MKNFDEIIKKVQKPGRYIGCETNHVKKEFTDSMVSVALAYPDTYEIGMSYLGLRLLYHLLNDRENIICERVFAPWFDMEEELRTSGDKLFSLESKKPINEFDIVGFSLSYELTFTNVLNMLDLGGISVMAAERRDDEPLVIAGGACCYNPEPMSAFIDLFVIGDGEEALPELVEAYGKLKAQGLSKKEILKKFSGMKGIYVPSLYSAKYQGGSFAGLEPLEADVPVEISKNAVDDLNEAYYPVKQIVPFINIVHDRIAVEIMRGCPNSCRFCQAREINRPIRLRSPEKIREICQETYANTGYETIALLSLSSVNYPHLTDVVKGLTDDFKDKGVGISIPSLKVDEAFYELPEMLTAVRKTGLTFAPEAANDELREALGKDVDINILCKSATIAYEHGWRRLKLYFMVGFPMQPEDEAESIIRIARELSRLKKNVSGGAAEIKVSVNAFVPKAHTPFQWLGMGTIESLLAIRKELKRGRTKKIQIEFDDLEKPILEACVSRGDRRISGVIYDAWKNGAKMDSWRDSFKYDAWVKSFEKNGLDMNDYAFKKFELSDKLPWDHIHIGHGKEALAAEYKKSGF